MSEESSSAASSVPPVKQAPSSSPPTSAETQLGTNDIIKPRRACAGRVTVLGLSVRPSVRLSVRLLPRFLLPRVMKWPRSDTNGFSTTLAFFDFRKSATF